MTDTDIVTRLAREAGFAAKDGGVIPGASSLDEVAYVEEYPCGEALARFAALVAAECAKVCEEQEADILAKQKQGARPGSDEDVVNVNLRMVTVMLPGTAARIRAKFKA